MDYQEQVRVIFCCVQEVFYGERSTVVLVHSPWAGLHWSEYVDFTLILSITFTKSKQTVNYIVDNKLPRVVTS